MRKKSARKHKLSRRTKKHTSFYFWSAAIIIVILVLTGKAVYKNLQSSTVLGKSVFLAQDFQAPPPGDSGSGGGNPPPPHQDQPQQQSRPQQQAQPPQEQHSQPAPQQGQAQQMNAQQMQQQYQQMQQGGNSQQYQSQNQKPPMTQEQIQQYQRQYSSSQQQNQQQPQQSGAQQSQSPSGFGSTENNSNFNNRASSQPIPTQYQGQYQQMQQEYQQMQQQWQHQATQNGFQISSPSNTSAQPGQTGQLSNNQGGQQSSLALPSTNSFPTIRGQFWVGSAKGNSNINLNDKDTNVTLNSNNSLTAKRADGTEVAINQDALEKINTAIKLETGSEITTSGNNFAMKRGHVEAESKFPISFNIATKTFSVQTSVGAKEIAVLPDQAVEKALQSGIINNLSGGNTTQGQSSNSKVQLTEYNNQPVYQVEGASQKKLFGLLPVSIAKATYVSAQTGNVVSTNQGIFSRFLDAISF